MQCGHGVLTAHGLGAGQAAFCVRLLRQHPRDQPGQSIPSATPRGHVCRVAAQRPHRQPRQTFVLVLTATGTGPLPSRVQAIADFPRLATVKQLKAFLALFNLYRRFIPAAAKLILFLTRALRGGPKVRRCCPGCRRWQKPFAVARSALSPLAVLGHLVAVAELSLVMDASARHVGAVIQQHHHDQAWQLLVFFSAQLDKAQANYSAFDRELLAVAAIRHIRYMLEGRSFVVFTNHKPLVGALHRRSDPVSARQLRYLSFIA